MHAKRVAVAVFTISALVAAACGDDDSTEDDTAAEGRGSSETTAAPELGDPIKLAVITQTLLLPDTMDGFEAALGEINAAGGVQGHELEVVGCDDRNDANVGAQCARDAISDESVIALAGGLSAAGSAINPLLEEAGMAHVGIRLSTQADFASPNGFPFEMGAPVTIGGAAVLADIAGATKICMPYFDSPSGATLGGLVDLVLNPRGLELQAFVPVAATATDLSSQAAALSECDGISIALPSDLATRMILAIRQQGIDVPVAVSTGVHSAESLAEEVGDAAEGVILFSAYDILSDGFADFNAAMDEHNPDGKRNLHALNAWLSAHVFADVANDLSGEITRESILEAMSALSGYDTNGLTGEPLDFTATSTVAGGALPRMLPHATYVWAYDQSDGETTPAGEAINPFEPPGS